MPSLYRAHITGEKDFRKPVTLQCKQYKKTGTLFCGNGESRVLRWPRWGHLQATTHAQGKPGMQGRVSLQSTEFGDVLAWGPHPSTASPTTPHPQEVTAWRPGRPAGENPTHPPGHRACARGKCSHHLGFEDQFYHLGAP